VVDGDKVGVDNAVDDEIEELGWFLLGSRLQGALQNLVAYAGRVAHGDEEVASDKEEDIRKPNVPILHRLNIFEDQEEIVVRSLGLEALIVAAAVLNVEGMELKPASQLVQLRVIGIIYGVPGHEDPPATRRTWLGNILVKKSEHLRSLCSPRRCRYDAG
jgi:hypothetical protein